MTWNYHHLRQWSFEVQEHLPPHLHYRETPYVAPTVPVVSVAHDDPRDPYVAARDVASVLATDDDVTTACEETLPFKLQGFLPRDSYMIMPLYGYSLRVFLCCDRIMPPKAISQAAIERLVTQRVNDAMEMERARHVNTGGQGRNTSGARSQGGAPAARAKRIAQGNKRTWESSQCGNNSNNRNNNMNNTRHHQQNNQRQGNARAITTALAEQSGYAKNKPLFNRCKKNHFDNCKIVCNNYGRTGHMARDCKGKTVATGPNAQPILTCYECGEKGNTRNHCLKKDNPQGEEARGQADVIKEAEKNQGPNTITGTFLLNNHYATVLFDSGSDKSFMNTSFSHLIDINPVKLNTSYEVELADGRVSSTNIVLRGCTLNLVNHLFKINLMPIELGTFDVVIGMDWLVEQDVVMVISCIKTRKYIEKGHQLFVAHVTEKEPKEKRLDDVLIIKDFPEVFPDDLPRMPPHRQVEFRIDLVPGAAPVARALYRHVIDSKGVHVDLAKIDAIKN
uniref:Reverse transcriptase domain-containing protein n=1 Tax=Tanacetum cinerariifolium TaxID=118510 RepID=A0A6L2N6R8_TANCI|nr:hypothetical protein [Tanacetum cinerariifolium]